MLTVVERDVAAEPDGDVADLKQTPWSSTSLRPIARSSSSTVGVGPRPVDAAPLERDVVDSSSMSPAASSTALGRSRLATSGGADHGHRP